MPKPNKPKFVGWFPSATATDYEAGIDTNEKHSGTRCAYLKSLVPKPKQFGNLTQAFAPDKYFGKRLRMSAWVKTELKNQGKAQLWLRIDNADESKKGQITAERFDNMGNRPIQGSTDWAKYDLVVDVAAESTLIVFGLMLIGEGQAWLDDVSFEAVSKDVPLTGKKHCGYPGYPVNLNFEED